MRPTDEELVEAVEGWKAFLKWKAVHDAVHTAMAFERTAFRKRVEGDMNDYSMSLASMDKTVSELFRKNGCG